MAVKKDSSLASQITKIKLPKVCYAIDPKDRDRILMLDRLTVQKPEKSGWDRIFPKIVDLKFPDLVDNDDSEEEDW